jgi:hypothetical protein
LLDRLQWADWDRDGRLQVGHVDRNSMKIVFDEDLAPLTPNPIAAPSWTQQW